MTGRLLSVLLLSVGISAAGNPVALTRPDGKNNWNLGRNGQAKIAGEHLIMDDGSPEQGAYAGTFGLRPLLPVSGPAGSSFHNQPLHGGGTVSAFLRLRR